MNPITIAFVAAPNAQREEIHNKVEINLSTHYNMVVNTVSLKTEEKESCFESYYKASLRYMIEDIKSRSVARKNNIPILLYEISPLDIIAMTKAKIDIGVGYKMLIENNLLGHLERFPINLLLYCEPLSYDSGKPDFMSKEKHKLLVDAAIMRLLEKREFETIQLGPLEDRVNRAIELITLKMARK